MNTLRFNLSMLVILSLLEIVLSGYIGIWRESFWQAVSQYNLHIFIIKVVEFTLAALTICFVSSYGSYLISIISLHYRKQLTFKSLHLPYEKIEGGEQRIQEDCNNYPFYLLSLSVGIIKNIVLLIVYMSIIWYQIGSLYIFYPAIFVITCTIIAYKIAKPLIGLNYQNQCVEAEFRRNLLTFKGKVTIITSKFAEVCQNNLNVFKATKNLNYFQNFYNQIVIIASYLIIAPLYFKHLILFGVFMQIGNLIGALIDMLSYILNQFSVINSLLSCKKRLKELKII